MMTKKVNQVIRMIILYQEKNLKQGNRKWYKQSFNDAWLIEPELQDWISKDPGNKFTVRCKVVNIHQTVPTSRL